MAEAVPINKSPDASYWERLGNTVLNLVSAKELAKLDYEYRDKPIIVSDPAAQYGRVDAESATIKSGVALPNIDANTLVVGATVLFVVVVGVLLVKYK